MPGDPVIDILGNGSGQSDDPYNLIVNDTDNPYPYILGDAGNTSYGVNIPLTPNEYGLTPNSGARPPAKTPVLPNMATPPKPGLDPHQNPAFAKNQNPGQNSTNTPMKGNKGEENRGVKYLTTADQRAKYLVEVAAKLKRRSFLLDTPTIKQHFMSKEEKLAPEQRKIGAATLGRSRKTNQPFKTPDEWWKDALIWVCAKNEADKAAFYSHVTKIKQFHHSTFNAGQGVIGAGEWIVKDGILKKISSNSGHYRPPIDSFYQAVLHMAPAFNADTTVYMYDSVDDQWVERPVHDFIKAPSLNNRFWVHPEAKLG